MNFICEKSVLQNAIATAVRAVPSKSPISTLEGILLTAKEGTLRITGYDLKKAIYTEIEADVKEEGKSRHSHDVTCKCNYKSCTCRYL